MASNSIDKITLIRGLGLAGGDFHYFRATSSARAFFLKPA